MAKILLAELQLYQTENESQWGCASTSGRFCADVLSFAAAVNIFT